MGDVPLQCRAVQFTEVNSGPKGRVGGLMLPSTAQRLLAAASLSSSGQGNVPTGILREGQAAELQAGAPGQVIAAFLCLWESNFIPPTPLKRKIYQINIYILVLLSEVLVVRLFHHIFDQSFSPQKAFQVGKLKTPKYSKS